MSICIACAVELPGVDALCPHHHTVYPDDGWAHWNRIVCDLIHRRIEPPAGDPADDAKPDSEEGLVAGLPAVAACLESVA
jgi:hypothetical protein